MSEGAGTNFWFCGMCPLEKCIVTFLNKSHLDMNFSTMNFKIYTKYQWQLNITKCVTFEQRAHTFWPLLTLLWTKKSTIFHHGSNSQLHVHCCFSQSQYSSAKPLQNDDIVSVHFNYFYCTVICDKLRRDLAMFTYIYLNVDVLINIFYAPEKVETLNFT